MSRLRRDQKKKTYTQNGSAATGPIRIPRAGRGKKPPTIIGKGATEEIQKRKKRGTNLTT